LQNVTVKRNERQTNHQL